MKRKLTDNLSLKIISILIGIVLWLVVVNIDNPVISKSFTLSNVELVNEAYIDDTGLVCLRDGEATPVRVTITGERSMLNGITASDISVVADLQQAVSLETNPVMIPVTASCNGVSPANITVWPQNVSVTLEEKVTGEFMVGVNSGDSKPGKGYEIGTQTVSPEKVRITGPGSLIRKIDKVNVYVNVEGVTEDFTETANMSVIDKNGETLSVTQMNNLRFDNDGRVTVATKLWKTRSDIRPEVRYRGEPAEGYVLDSVSTVPETVSVAGTKEALELLKGNGNIIEIDDESVDISGQDSDKEFKIDISQYMPEGLKLTSGSNNEILVTFRILPEGGKRLSIPTSKISVKGKKEGLQISFEIDKLEIRVKADDEQKIVDFDEKDEEAVKASIDVEGMDEGSYQIPVEITLPDGFELLEEASTEIVISKVSTASDTTEE